MDPETRGSLIARYADGPRVVAEAVAKLGPARLDATPPAGGWTPRQVVHHLADSEMTSALRLRRLIAEDHPAIQAYDEELWSRRVHYDRPVAASLAAMAAARASTAEILTVMTEEEWTREGTHSELGRYTPEIWLEIYARHAHDHAGQMLGAAAL